MSTSSMSHGSSINVDKIHDLPLETPRGWSKEYTDIVLRMFKGKDGLNDDVSIEKVKSVIVDKMIEKDPKVPEHSGKKLLESEDVYGRDFDAHFFHFLLKKFGLDPGISSNTGLLERFTWDSRNNYSKFICAHSMAIRVTKPGEQGWHYVLELEQRFFSRARFRCITCGETELLVNLGDPPHSLIESMGGYAGARRYCEDKIAALVALPRGEQETSYTVLKKQMHDAGILFLNDWPNGLPGEAN
ncbi:hypothetical protein G7Y79_00001g003380 [Physcia stellaris]|nr:hypothetical protein G7Y79_00001g003380 [Physcia stellaris]